MSKRYTLSKFEVNIIVESLEKQKFAHTLNCLVVDIGAVKIQSIIDKLIGDTDRDITLKPEDA